MYFIFRLWCLLYKRTFTNELGSIFLRTIPIKGALISYYRDNIRSILDKFILIDVYFIKKKQMLLKNIRKTCNFVITWNFYITYILNIDLIICKTYLYFVQFACIPYKNKVHACKEGGPLFTRLRYIRITNCIKVKRKEHFFSLKSSKNNVHISANFDVFHSFSRRLLTN